MSDIRPNPRPSKFLEDDRIVRFWRYGTLGDVIDEYRPAEYASEASAQGTLDFLENCVTAAREQGSENARIETREVIDPEFGTGVSYWHYDGSGALWHHYDVFTVDPK